MAAADELGVGAGPNPAEDDEGLTANGDVRPGETDEGTVVDARGRRVGWATLLIPPLLGVIFAEALLLAAAVSNGTAGGFFLSSHWGNYDSGLYLSIAAKGYSLVHCMGPAYPPNTWCGTAGWAPLYPGLMALVSHTGVSLPYAGMLLSVAFSFLTLLAMWVLIGPEWSFGALCCLALAACFPGMVYYYAIFPISLTTFLSVVCLILLIRHRHLLAGLAGAVAVWAFSTGPLVAACMFLAQLIVDRGRGFWGRIVRSVGVPLASFAGLLLAYQWWVGTWKGVYEPLAKYDTGLQNPITTFLAAFTGGTPGGYPLQGPNPAYTHLIPKAQTAFVAALVLMLLVWVLWRRPITRMRWVVLVYTMVLWILPLIEGPSLSRYRIEGLLVPCVALCKDLPRPVQVALLACAAVLAVGLARLFAEGLLE